MAHTPVAGYTEQSEHNLLMVNNNKETEELLLQTLDSMTSMNAIDQRWLAIARTHFEQGFMALNRSIFRPQRLNIRKAGD